MPADQAAADGMTVNQVMAAYLDWAQTYYAAPAGPGKEYVNLTHALRPVRALYGSAPAIEFGPLALKAVRQHMIDVQGVCRSEINKRIGRIRRMFKWAVAGLRRVLTAVESGGGGRPKLEALVG